MIPYIHSRALLLALKFVLDGFPCLPSSNTTEAQDNVHVYQLFEITFPFTS